MLFSWKETGFSCRHVSIIFGTKSNFFFLLFTISDDTECPSFRMAQDCWVIQFSWYLLHHSWRRKWQPTPVSLPTKSQGWRSLVGYSPWGRKESDTTERLHFHFHFFYTHWEVYSCAKQNFFFLQSYCVIPV